MLVRELVPDSYGAVLLPRCRLRTWDAASPASETTRHKGASTQIKTLTTALTLSCLALSASTAAAHTERQRNGIVTPQGSIDGTQPLHGEAFGEASGLLVLNEDYGLHVRGTVHVTPGNVYSVS